MAIKMINESPPKPGNLGRAELYALAIGQVIGAGVITLIVPAIKMTGYSAWLAYLAAILLGLIMILPFVFVSSTLRLGGGNYSMICRLAGAKPGGIFAFCNLTQCVSLSLFGVSAAHYLGDIIPALGTPIVKTFVGIGLLTFFYVVNMMGIDVMAKAQKFMTWFLIGALALFAIIGCFNLKLPVFDFTDPNFLIHGWGIEFTNGQVSGGFLGAMLLFVYSCTGYSMTIAYGRDSKDAKRDIPFALLLSVPTLILLYVGVAIAGTGVLSVAEYGESTTLVFAAQKIFPSVLFHVFIIGGPIMALLSMLNSSFAYNAINIGQSCDDGWLPEVFGKKNKHGARVYILTFMYILGVIPIAFNLSISVITNMIQLFTSFFAFLNFIAFWNLPKEFPEQWKKSRLHVGDGMYKAICILSLLGNLFVFWKSTLSMTPVLAIINVAALIIMAMIGLYRAKYGNIEIHTSVWTE